MEREKHEENSDIMNVNGKYFRLFFSVEFRLYAHHTDIIWPMSILIYYLYVIRHDTADLQILTVLFFSPETSRKYLSL